MTEYFDKRTYSKFKLFSVAEDYSAMAGGVPAVVNQLSHRVAMQGHAVHVLYAQGDGIPTSFSRIEQHCVTPWKLTSLWKWSPQLRPNIEHLVSLIGPTVFHLHGIWAAPQYVAAKVAAEHSIPFILSAHGMLEPWLWNQQGWKLHIKKQLYWNMFAKSAFSAAGVVHAITPLEHQHLRILFPSNQIEVIPNAIDLDEFPDDNTDMHVRSRLILFLGRVEPKKGVDILLRAFAHAKISSDWRVAIVGPIWSRSYLAVLKQIVAQHDLADRVAFVGPAFGEEKLHWMRKAWVMAVPSHSEVVGLVNLEAAAYRVPSITTHQTGLFDWESGGGLLIQPDVDEMKIALEDACSWSDSERFERGLSSRRLVAERYSWRVILPLWMSLYAALR